MALPFRPPPALIIPPISIPLLDRLAESPLLAAWIGGLLRAAYTGPIIRIRRGGDGAQRDIRTIAGITDIAAIAEHCAGTVGYLVTVYDQGLLGHDIAQADVDKQAVIYSTDPLGEIADGIVHVTGPVLGANGYLAAAFDGNPDNTGERFYLRDDALGLSGDPTFTMLCDLRTRNDVSQYFAPMNLGRRLVTEDVPSSEFNTAITGYRDAPDQLFRFFELVLWPFPPNSYSNVRFLLYPFAGWVQSAHVSGTDVFATPMRINGVGQVFESGGAHGVMLNMVAPNFISWGGYPAYAGYPTYDTIPGISSQLLVFGAALDANDQAVIDAWVPTHGV